MTSQNTAIVSHGTVETQPSQIYGSGTPILRIGYVMCSGPINNK